MSITCAENDQLVMVSLRHGTATAFLGADDDLRYIVQRVRAEWPDIEIQVRSDSGFGVPLMLDLCEELRLFYTLGDGMNPVLKRHTEELLQQFGSLDRDCAAVGTSTLAAAKIRWAKVTSAPGAPASSKSPPKWLSPPAAS